VGAEEYVAWREAQGGSAAEISEEKDVLERVSRAGNPGLPVDQFPEVNEAALQRLLNYGLVVRIPDFDGERLVSSSHASRYTLPSGQVIRPWLLQNGSLNLPFINQLRALLVSHVVRRAGITGEALCEAMHPILNPQGTKQLLSVLELDGLVTSSTVIEQVPSLLGSRAVPHSFYHPSARAVSLFSEL
jgi:hypothetical protein